MHAIKWVNAHASIAVSILVALFVMCQPVRAVAQATDDTAVSESKTPPAQMAGTWTGPLNDDRNGPATLTLDLTQVASTVGGTFSSTTENGPSGTVAGKVDGEKAKLTLTATNQSHPCKVRLTGKVVSLDEYMGKFKSIIDPEHCKAKGTFDVILQP